MTDNKIIDQAISLIKPCKLPKLKKQIGDVEIKSEHFTEFRKVIDETLLVLFDVFHQNIDLLIVPNEDNNDNFEFRLIFVKVLCEQTASNTLFQTKESKLLKQFHKILKNPTVLVNDVIFIDKLFDSYEENLRGDNWKYNFGEIFGFLRFCQILDGSGMKMDTKKASFLLSFGLSLTDYHDPEFQVIGMQLFNILMDRKNKKLMMETNIHQVIYDNTFRLIKKSKEEDFVLNLWECLYKFVLIEELPKKEFNKWSKMDDIIESLVECLAFESEMNLSSILLNQIIRFISIDLQNSDDFMFIPYCDLVHDVQERCKNFKNFRIYRWIKKILLLIPNELSKCGGDPETASNYLNGIHVIYTIAIFSIDPSIIEHQLLDFLESFMKVLMEVINIYQNEDSMIKTVKSFLDTIVAHLQQMKEKNNMTESLEMLLEHEIFKE